MKRTYLITVLALFITVQTFAYSVGHTSITYTDPARANRSVATEIYYPATLAGTNTPFASGQFPVIVFGHGFVMGYDSYAYFYNAMATLGYIVALPTTEGSTSPVHADFGADLAFLINQLQSEGTNSGSTFYNHVAVTSAVMGHSMGGGSSFLACENNTVPTCMVTFAAAETTPSSTGAAANITIPSLVVSGSADCVAPPADHQTPMYNALACSCKSFVSITDGCHCYFGDYNFNCTLGESFCDPVPPLDRATQQSLALKAVRPYLNFYLNGSGSWQAYTDSLASTSGITYQISCPTSGIVNNGKNVMTVKAWPNPANNEVNVQFESQGNYLISIVDAVGSKALIETFGSTNGKVSESIDISSLGKGIYFIAIEINSDKVYNKIIKL